MKELFANGAMLCLFFGMLFTGCRTEETHAYESGDGVSAIVYQLQSQFGMKGKYSNIHMRYEDSSGLVISVTGIAEGNADSLVVRQLKHRVWNQISSTPLNTLGEVQYFYTMDSLRSMQILPELVKNSLTKLAKDDQRTRFMVKEVLVTALTFDPESDPIRYNIYVRPKDANVKYEFSYNVSGKLKSIQDY